MYKELPIGTKISFEHIHFEKTEDKPKTSVWECRNNKSGDLLGHVKYWPSWRQYCFLTSSEYGIILSVGCMADIQKFIERLKG